MKKRFLSMLLAAIMVLAIIPVSAFTALAAEGTDGEVIVTVTKSALSVGETTELFFRINAKTDPLGSANIYITIPEGLEYVSHEILVSTTDYMFSAYNVTSGLFGFAVTSTGKTGTFDAFKLTLRAKDVNIGANAVGLRVGNMSKLDGATMMNYGSLEAITITTSISITHAHVYGNEFNGADATSHWKECTDLACPDKEGSKTAVTPHSGGTATCTAKAVCTTCNTAYGEIATHTHGTEFKNDANNHWNECVCGNKANVAPHADTNNDEKCDACSYAMPKAPSDNETEKPTEKPTDATDKPTDATDKPTDATDKPTDATESEKDDSTETETPADKGSGGCGASATLSTLAIVAVVGSALVIKKKED